MRAYEADLEAARRQAYAERKALQEKLRAGGGGADVTSRASAGEASPVGTPALRRPQSAQALGSHTPSVGGGGGSGEASAGALRESPAARKARELAQREEELAAARRAAYEERKALQAKMKALAEGRPTTSSGRPSSATPMPTGSVASVLAAAARESHSSGGHGADTPASGRPTVDTSSPQRPARPSSASGVLLAPIGAPASSEDDGGGMEPVDASELDAVMHEVDVDQMKENLLAVRAPLTSHVTPPHPPPHNVKPCPLAPAGAEAHGGGRRA